MDKKIPPAPSDRFFQSATYFRCIVKNIRYNKQIKGSLYREGPSLPPGCSRTERTGGVESEACSGSVARRPPTMTASVAERRIKKELQKLRNAREELGMTVEVGSSPIEWFVTIIGERHATRAALRLIRARSALGRAFARVP